jgi:D-3-phosphoglycerate dehydrogenase
MGLCNKAGRVTILHQNIPNMLTRFTAVFAQDGVNISDMVNRSRGEYAYTMMDIDAPTTEEFVEDLRKIDGIIRVRVIK